MIMPKGSKFFLVIQVSKVRELIEVKEARGKLGKLTLV